MSPKPSMINKPTCYKNPEKPSCVDLILTNCTRSFQNSCVIETELSDFNNGHYFYENNLWKKET